MKNFVKDMDKTGRGFEYVKNKFPDVSDAKIRGYIYRTPDQGTDARCLFHEHRKSTILHI